MVCSGELAFKAGRFASKLRSRSPAMGHRGSGTTAWAYMVNIARNENQGQLTGA